MHYGHIQIHDDARACLEARYPKMKVVASYISPSHDSYVLDKMRRSKREHLHLNFESRAAMVRAAVADHPLLDVDLVSTKYTSMLA